MRRLIQLFLTTAFVSCVLAGQSPQEKIEAYRMTLCSSPNMSEIPLEDKEFGLQNPFVYNSTSKKCEYLSGRENRIIERKAKYGVFFTGFDCVLACTPNDSSYLCGDGPHMPYNDNCTIEPREAYFFNMTLQDCQKYNACVTSDNFPKSANMYKGQWDCRSACIRFDQYNIKSFKQDCAPKCSGPPPVPCDADWPLGSTRYFYNDTSMQCEEYQMCYAVYKYAHQQAEQEPWPNGTSPGNYYLTKEFCEYSCMGSIFGANSDVA